MSDDVSDNEDALTVPVKQQRVLLEPNPINTNTPLINLVRDFNVLTPASHVIAQTIMKGTLAISTTTGSAAVTQSMCIYDDAKMKIMSSIDNVYEIPQVVVSLVNSGLHVPLMLLTAATIEKIHTDLSCITMKKGLVLSDLKKSILNTSNFPAESTLTPVEFYEAMDNFLELLKLITSHTMIEKFTTHRCVC
ncbi:hypothetical protein BDR05DRAFT_1002785 [Suillus weaverae]|nr:hypothetical protein BDR05DRAFT_1002785 [Suillus weaverae]